MSLFGIEFGNDADESERLARVEAKLDAIIKHLGVEFEWRPVSDKVQQLATAGKTIEAIKVYREQTGASLAIAKRRIDSI